jgi:hypothetical protein
LWWHSSPPRRQRPASVGSVSPQGEVAQVRQVTVKFSEAVVPFGDLRLPDPVSLQCVGPAPAGAGRWIDDRTWQYDFRDSLPPGVRCAVKARAEWKPLSAAGAAQALTGPTEWAFSTGGPAVVSTQPWEGAEIEEDQHFLLTLTGPADTATAAANAWCEVDGIGERLPAVVVAGPAREALLKARPHRRQACAADAAAWPARARCHPMRRCAWSGARESPAAGSPTGRHPCRAALRLQGAQSLQRRVQLRTRARERGRACPCARWCCGFRRLWRARVAGAGSRCGRPPARR